MNRRLVTLVVGLVISLGGVNALVIQKEHLIATGTRVFLRLAPVDPRSLMQGDYLRLDYAAARDVANTDNVPSDGNAVLGLDERGVGTFIRLHHDGDALAPGEHLIRFKTRDGRIRIGSGAFFFQEGHATYYEDAEYGELRVGSFGTSVLIGLCDKDVVRIMPKEPPAEE